MKLFKILFYTSLLLISISLLNCKSTKENSSDAKVIVFQEKPSFELGQVSFQKWTAGIQEGGSGIHMYISVITNKKNVVFDSVYFRGLNSKITIGKMGYYANLLNVEKQDIIMSGNSKDEYGNKPTTSGIEIPFDLGNDECIISYKELGELKYYKFNNLVEKESLSYPSTSPN